MRKQFQNNFLKFLPPNIYSYMCQSLGLGFEEHGWLLIYDNMTNRFLIGICSHVEVLNSCDGLKCENAFIMYQIMQGIDFNGKVCKGQFMRNFILLDDTNFNLQLLKYLKENNIKNIDNSSLNYGQILELINSNEFIYADKSGKFFFDSKEKGILELKCCLSLNILFSLK